MRYNKSYNNISYNEEVDRLNNPFIISGRYVSEEYFCDRESETQELVSNIVNWRNSVLVSFRRMGKSGLIEHTFAQKAVCEHFETFYIDIYATSSLEEFVVMLGKEIVSRLQGVGQRFFERFLGMVGSLKASLSADPITGMPSIELALGEKSSATKTLEQIFSFLESSESPCVVAIDEFQQIAEYHDGKKTIAYLRTLVQNCKQTRFIFAGSNRRMMGELFNSPSEPFFMSCSTVPLEAIDKAKYRAFAMNHFKQGGKVLESGCFDSVYDRFDGHTWYVQYVMNRIYDVTPVDGVADVSRVGSAIEYILGVNHVTYQTILANYSERQRSLLIAVAKEGRVKGILSSAFINKYRLNSSSSVQGALKPLIDNETVIRDGEEYYVGNRFFSLWLSRR